VIKKVRDYIENNHLKVDDRLPTEHDTAEKSEVSGKSYAAIVALILAVLIMAYGNSLVSV
jgi:hypothetical protein